MIMHKNVPAMVFDTDTHSGEIMNRRIMPVGIRREEDSWDAVRSFCASRTLMAGRMYAKEIRTSCGIDDQSDMNICITSKALSLRDSFWIKKEGSTECWESVNLYHNMFSEEIAMTGITGEASSVHIGDGHYTGELTNRGMSAKAYIRDGEGIFLAKAETEEEIACEVISCQLAEAIGLKSAEYVRKEVFGVPCSVCRIETSPDREMVHAREILSFCGSQMNIDSDYYRQFIEICGEQFLRMQVFDYITLNTDRNRDNFAIEYRNGAPAGLYPIYDHDSCYKGKSEKAAYFVTGKTFARSIELIFARYPEEMEKISGDVRAALPLLKSRQTEDTFVKLGLGKNYMGTLKRAEDIAFFKLHDT